MKRSTASTPSRKSPKQQRAATSSSAKRATKRSSATVRRAVVVSTDPAHYVHSVWFDLEPTLEDAMMMNVRSTLMDFLQKEIRERKWTQRRAAEEIGISQPRVSQLMGNHINRFSSDSLIRLLGRLGVDITVSATPRATASKFKRTG
jgi:predicted XRE-type DNA-binding protein